MDEPQQIINDFKEAVFNIWLRDGQNTWPIDINSIVHLFMDLFVEELLGDMESLRKKGYSSQDIASLFKSSARIIRLVMPCVLGMKSMKMPIEKQRRNILNWLSLVKLLKYGDLFNRDGKNTVLSPMAFKSSITHSKMLAADKKNSFLLHKLCAILWNYAEAVCFKTHGLVREFHGSYRFDKKNQEILVRDFICLRPVQLWQECRIIPYDSIRVVSVYENLGMTIDIYNNVTIKEGGRFIDNLKFFFVEADGKVLNLDEIDELGKLLYRIIISITSLVDSLDWRKKTEKYAEIFWFAKKELRDELRLDWSPAAAVKERIKAGEPSSRFSNISTSALSRMLRIAF